MDVNTFSNGETIALATLWATDVPSEKMERAAETTKTNAITIIMITIALFLKNRFKLFTPLFVIVQKPVHRMYAATPTDGTPADPLHYNNHR